MKKLLALLAPLRAHLVVPLFALLLFPLTERGQLSVEQQPGREDGTWRSLNNYSLIFLESWRQNGALRSRFGLEMPMDDTDYSFRKPYSSYPAGYLLPPFMLEKLSPVSLAEDSVSTWRRLRVFAGLNHFTLACLAGWIALALAGQLPAALAATFAALFLPPFLLFQHNVWWIDMVGLTVSAALFLLYLKLRANPAAASDRRFAFAVLASGLVDWFSPMLAGLLALASPRRRRLLILGALASAALLFLFQHYLLSSLHVVAYKFRVRTSIQAEGFTLPWLLWAWQETLRRFLGWGALLLPPLAFVAAALFREGRLRLRAFWPLPAAVLAHWLLFNQHYPGHHYNTIRWALALSLLPALFPRRFGLAASLLLAAWVTSVYPLYSSALDVTATDLRPEHLQACRLVERHRSAENLFVSEDFHFTHELMGHLWHFPWCKSMVTKASSIDDVVLIQQKRFVRFGFRVTRIARTFYLTTASAPPKWAPSSRRVDGEGPWSLYELPPL